MLFTTAAERTRCFAVLDADPERAVYGDAMRHAETTNLGAWGDEKGLREDVAVLMVAEIRRFLAEDPLGRHLPDLDERITPEAVAASAAFEAAFEAARRPSRAKTHNLVRSLGSNAEHMEPMDPSRDPAALDSLQARIAAEIVSLRDRPRKRY
jgi:hypothetical protein